ncbi:hypothetical protein SAZ11_04260 [Streptomyces sp. FXJ1.4098]|uniref:hypothetical protein n=1 Tax=Streptomyces sp. NPDC020845 TaxID=3365096 RepID=UPI002990F53E|nr:hypothetical protein [Streptomyces sp. FXJ1.4098]
MSGGQVKTVDIDDKGAIKGTVKNGTKFTTGIPTALNNSRLEQQLQSKHVAITASRSSSGSPLGILLALFLPLLFIAALFVWARRQATRTLSGGFGAIGRSRAKIIETERPTTRFEDIAGVAGTVMIDGVTRRRRRSLTRPDKRAPPGTRQVGAEATWDPAAIMDSDRGSAYASDEFRHGTRGLVLRQSTGRPRSPRCHREGRGPRSGHVRAPA